MKRIIITAIAVMAVAVAMMAENPLFKACEDMADVSTTFIGKTMMRHAGTALIGHGISSTAGKSGLDEVTVIEASTSKAATQVKNAVKKYESSRNFELIMKSKGDSELTQIHQGTSPDGKYEMLLVTEKGDKLTVVILSSSKSFDTLHGIFMPGIVN